MADDALGKDANLARLRKLHEAIDAEVPLESLLRAVVAMTVNGYAVVDLDDEVFISASDGFESMFGYASGELSGKNINLLIPGSAQHAKKLDGWRENPREMLMNRAPVAGLMKDQSEILVNLGITPMSNRRVLLMLKAQDPVRV